MQSMTLYIEKNTPLHQMDPLIKLLLVIVSIAVTYICPNLFFVGAVTLTSLILLSVGRVIHKIFPILALSMILIISIIVVQGAFHAQNATVLFSVGPLSFYKEGLLYALLLTLRVVNMVCIFGVLILTTRPDEMVERLVKKGMSPKIGYVLLSVLQIIPQMRATTKKVSDAQRARGMETQGSLIHRVKAFIPLIGPVVLHSLSDTRERALALELRGFNKQTKKTFLKTQRKYRHQWPQGILLVLIGIAAIVWRVVQ
ncbi:energy-coupling factor transporter transmembrane component T [Virgibacillus sp. 179-BFC.A HS]|uniref:Energy-coupling factor transporter transmembrane component T n=1 Tax=Tigheibacillus jepli TaxID=3035914 RepID=A0ABU5CF41_9BACI|nr:energy-coupling factor transporter transmembrane component T [Virgibacillus sp. 179-BFC.A HS]MDY0404940.1 energy-coupling factor transporter transmembrane component T [Virgibacillus sp. 179-BFC.A HS]